MKRQNSLIHSTLASASKRPQPLLLRLQQYNVEIRYKPGPEMYPVDTLVPCLPANHRSLPHWKRRWANPCCWFLGYFTTTACKDPARNSSRSCPTVPHPSYLKGLAREDDLLIELHPYHDVREELTAQDGVLFKGLWCLILSSLRP